MSIYIHDEGSNEYLSKMFWSPLIAYGNDHGLRITKVQETDSISNSVLLIHGDRLSPERIRKIKEAGNKLICWDINDSSYLSSAYIHSPEQHLIDLVFKVSGVPKQNEVNEMNLDRNFKIQISREKYLPDEQWEDFCKLRHKLRPLPYVLWSPIIGPSEPLPSASQRSGKVLVRGGNHFWRVVLMFRLMQDGKLDSNSEFNVGEYFKPTMERRFAFCDECKNERAGYGKSLYDAPVRRNACTSPVTGWEIPGEFYGGPMYGRHEHGYWNNRCPHSFFFLAKEFERLRGPLDHPFLEKAFNGDMQPASLFVTDLKHASYYGDAKWLNTINLPPRFWEGASVGTPCFFPDRTVDQDYWPPINKNEHYFTYPEHMDQFELSPDLWSGVSRAVKALYEEKIRGTKYSIGTPLLEYMATAIRQVL